MTALNGFGRRRWTGIAVGALVVVLAACGSQAKTVEVKKKVAPSPRAAVLASVRTTASAKSARMSMSMGAGLGAEHFTITGDGVTDFVTGDSALTMQFPGIGSEPGGSIEMLVVDRAAYLKMPETLFGGLLGSGKWFKMPNLGDANSAVPGLGQSDPSQFLAYLETVSAGVTKVGTETIRGVETTHYEATLDLAKAIDRADVPESLRDDLGEIVQKHGASFTMPADVWVDNDGLARRVQLKLDLAQVAGTDRETGLPVMTMSMDFYDFGVPVHVEAPPADEVTEFPFGPTGSTGTDGAAA
jgi:hypothetical protein